MINIHKVILAARQEQVPHTKEEAAHLLSQHGLTMHSPEVLKMMKAIQTGKTASLNSKLLGISAKTGWPIALLMAVSMLMPQESHAADPAPIQSGIERNFRLPEDVVQKVKMSPQWLINVAGLNGFTKVVSNSMMVSLKDDSILSALNKVPQNVWADSLSDAAMRRLQSKDLADKVQDFMKANDVDTAKMQGAIKSAVLSKMPEIKSAVQKLSERNVLV